MIVWVGLFDTDEQSHPGNFKQKNGFLKEPLQYTETLRGLLNLHSQELCSLIARRCFLWKHHRDGENYLH